MIIRRGLVFLGLLVLILSQLSAETASLQKGAKRSLSRLVSDLSGEDAVALFSAEQELIKKGDAAIPALEPLATSPGVTAARKYAINILGNIGTEKAIKVLLRIMEEEQNVIVRGVVCPHLGRLQVEEAIPIIGRWLFTNQGKRFDYIDPKDNKRINGSARVLSPAYGWLEHVYALSEIGSEKAIPILEKMVKARHGGVAARVLMKTYRERLDELKKEVAFWKAVRHIPGLEEQAKLLFDFFRKDKLAIIRLYRDKVIRGGLEGRWVLEDMKKHPDVALQRAAAALLKNYGSLTRQTGRRRMK